MRLWHLYVGIALVLWLATLLPQLVGMPPSLAQACEAHQGRVDQVDKDICKDKLK